MKKYYIFTLSIALLSITLVKTEDSEWYSTANDILTDIQNLVANFDKEIAIVPELEAEVDRAYESFDLRQAEQKFLFDCTKKEFKKCNDTIEQQENDLEKKNLQLKNLQHEIDALEFDMEKEVKRLNKLIEISDKKLKEAQDAYASLANFNDDKAKNLVEALSDLKKKYESALTIRQNVINKVLNLLKRINSYNLTTRVATEDLGVIICNPGFIQALNQIAKELA